jgi:hypothetical protein
MQEITYTGRKAYLLTSEDLFLFNRPFPPMETKKILYKLETARKDGFVFIFIMTSLNKQAIPATIRRYLSSGQKKCYFGLFTSFSETGNKEKK